MDLGWLLDPWTSGLMRRAFAETVLVGAVCGALGCLVLLRGLAFLGESLAHTMVLGVVLAFLLGVPAVIGAGVIAAATAVAVSGIGREPRLGADTAMGVLLPSLFGAGVVLVAVTEGYRSRLEDVLFGTVLGATELDLALALAAAVATALALAFAGKEIALSVFDRASAEAMGYRVAALELLVLVLVTLAAAVALRAVGSLLLAALLLGPPVTARLPCRSFGSLLAAGAAIGAASGLLGLYLSWHVDVGGGPAIALVVLGGFLVTYAAVRLPRRRLAAAVALLAGVLGASGCGGESGAGGDGRLEVVATTMQLQDFTRELGGARVRVTGILGPDAEPHEYEPTPDDADAVSEADVVVENGASLDEWLGDLLGNAGSDARRVVAAEGVALLPTEEEGFPGDPHVWHDPDGAKRMVDNVAAGLAAADPPGRATYERNATAYKAELDAMAEQIRALFAPVPRARRVLVTSHDAFGYFARAHGVEVVGSVLPSITTEGEPSARQVQRLIEEIRRRDVRVIFTEESVEPRLERQIAEEAGAEVSTSLYADVLGAPGTPEASFIGAEIANARAMAEAWR